MARRGMLFRWLEWKDGNGLDWTGLDGTKGKKEGHSF